MTESTDSIPESPLGQPEATAKVFKPTKTPMYEAANAARYHRQELIKQIQEKTRTRLIAYVCGIEATIDRDDSIGFMELLHNVPKGVDLEFMLHTSGGDLDAAEKLISLLHSYVPQNGRLTVIVPDLAKSAGTLMTLGATTIVMSDSSELGPIDPQVKLDDGRGNAIYHSVLHYLEAYQRHSNVLALNSGDVPAALMMNKLDPTTVQLFDSVRKRAQTLAEKQLNRRMFHQRSGPWTAIVSKLMDIQSYPSHGQVINWQEAKEMGLEIEYRQPTDELWRMYWRLYCLQRLAISDHGKLFESEYASYAVEKAVR
jgi:hypothetical protein